MGWEVFGDVAFLEIILNAIAAMFSPFRTGAGSNEYSGMVSAGALIGVLLMVATAVIMVATLISIAVSWSITRTLPAMPIVTAVVVCCSCARWSGMATGG